MRLSYGLQRHLCALFLTAAVLTSLVVIKRKNSIHNDSERVGVGEELSQVHTQIRNFEDFGGGEGVNNKSEVIYILGLFELSTRWGDRAEGASEMAAAQLAVSHINSLNVLPGYSLQLLINDTKCDPGIGIDTFFHAIYSRKTFVMLLGTSCSNVTESLAHVVPYWNILHISFGSTSPTLSDRKKFPLFFRTVAPDSSHNRAKIAFVKHFQWRTVAMFCESADEFLLPLNNLVRDFEKENISCLTTVTFSADNYKEQLKVLQGSDVRIVIGSFSDYLGERVFCEVFRLGMYGEEYVWILQEKGGAFWEVAHGDCDERDLGEAVDGLVLVADFNVVAANSTSISGLNGELFESQLNLPNSNISKYATLAYDAVWTMALGIRDTQRAFDEKELFNMELNYKSKDLVCEFVRQVSALNFMGISGPVKFIGPDRVGSSIFRQVQGRNVKDIAVFDPDSGKFDFKCQNCGRVSWWNRQIPIAQRILKVSLITIPEILSYSIICVSTLGIFVSLYCLYFNFRYRRMRTVKLSSPKLNNVALIGCILVYVSVILLSLNSSVVKSYFNQLCTVRVYLLSAGLSLAFGSMFAKAYRVHRIFASYGAGKIKAKLLKDKQLIALIFVPLIIDGIIFILWLTVDPMERQLYNLTLQINSEDRGIVYQPQVEICHSQNGSGWFIAIYGYKCLILIMGVFMAWETRHVKVQALNDSQYIGICVYGAVFSAIITALSSFITEYVVFSYLARTVSIITSTTITLLLLFIPKFSLVFSRHSQDPILQSMGLKIEYNTRRLITNDRKEQILRLEIQNKVYRCELEALDLEISRLESLIFEADPVEIFAISGHGNKNKWGSLPKAFSKSRDDLFFEKIPGFGKMKSVFGNIRMSLTGGDLNCDNSKIGKVVGNRHKSDPEFYESINVFRNRVIGKAKSEVAMFSGNNDRWTSKMLFE